MAARKLTRQDLREAAEKFKNWGRWGPNDEIGTLNYTQPEDIVAAARLVRKGKVISLALNFDQHGPQGAKSKYPALGRFNPIHLMTRTGTDAVQACRECRDRLYDMHVKDLASKTEKESQVEVGRGVIDFPALFKTLIEIGYKGQVGLEYEINAKNPLPGMIESMAYMRGVLAAVAT